MKQILCLLLACSLFVACDNKDSNKTKSEIKTETDKDANESKTSPESGLSTSQGENETRSVGDGWTGSERTQFVQDCVTAAMAGMDQSQAKSYCECMQPKIESKYGSFARANMITEEELKSEDWMKEVKKCLGQN